MLNVVIRYTVDSLFLLFSYKYKPIKKIKPDNAFYLSLTQIKPYSILFEEEPRKLISNLCDSQPKKKLVFYFPDMAFQNQQSNYQSCESLIQYKNGWVLVVWSILTSTFYIILLACVGLALRWNFRKA